MVLQKEKSKKSTQETLDDVTTGRKTIKTVFKSIDDTGKMVNKIEAVSTLLNFNVYFIQADKEIEALQVLQDLLTIYLGETIIPAFKKRKIDKYRMII